MTVTKLFDQYGSEVPEDLVTLPDPSDLNPFEIELVDDAVWYDVGGTLLASAIAINHLSDNDPIDSGIDLNSAVILIVGAALHRWTYADGFYHA